MRAQRLMIVLLASALATGVGFAQIGRTGSQWQTALGNAQRTSWLPTDDRISVPALSKPGFELQWKVKLGNRPRGVHGLGQGVTATGVTIFVPMSLVTGSSNTMYAVDNDLGYVVWERQFDSPLPAASAYCPGCISGGATRIVPLIETVTSRPAFGAGRGGAGYRSLLGQPGEGVPVEGRAAGAGRAGDPSPAANAGRGARGAAPAVEAVPPPPPAAQSGQAADRIPGSSRRADAQTDAERMAEAYGFGFLFKPSGVVYVIASDGMLHVLGLPSGKDMQRPAPFLPANAKWSSPIAVGTTLYAATSGDCGGAPSAVWAIDLDNEPKRVVSWKTGGGPVVGAVAFTSNGTLIAAIGAGRVTGDGKANALVALDPKTLQVKDWFSQPAADFVTGPTIIRHGDREIVAAATRDGRVWLLDATSLGGANHGTPLYVSKTVLGKGAVVSADALAAWRVTAPAPAASAPAPQPAQPAATDGAQWILLPVAGRLASGMPSTNGTISNGAVLAMKMTDSGGALALEPGWVSHDLAAPATPLIVNGVVFTLATGAPATASGQGTPAALHAYDGATGARVWTSGTAMTTFASPGSLWVGYGQVYVGGHDGTLHAFGFNDERRPTTDR
jgi:outer membrane protein assembly factor BamB